MNAELAVRLRAGIARISCGTLRQCAKRVFLWNGQSKLAVSSVPPDHPMNVFDRKAKARHRELAALRPDVAVYEYLKNEAGSRIADRVYDIKRKFPVAVELGSGRGYVSRNLNRDAIEYLYQCDMSPACLAHSKVPENVPTTKMVVDEEYLPFLENSVDIFFSSLSLHWVNDLPGTFRQLCIEVRPKMCAALDDILCQTSLQVLSALKPDGVFLGCVFGGGTLYELRGSLQLAETEREGGFAPHVSPFVEATDLAGLLQRTGFSLLTIDSEEIVVNYPSALHLMLDLKGMAENNSTWRRKSHLHRDSMIAASAIYQELYEKKKGVPATFHILSFIGWKPDPSQAKPAKRGSQTASFKDLGSMADPAGKR